MIVALAEVRDLKAGRTAGWMSFPRNVRLRDEFTMAGWRWRIAAIAWRHDHAAGVSSVTEVVARRMLGDTGADDGMVCVPVTGDSGEVLGHARVSPTLGAAGRQALAELTRAAIRRMEQDREADPLADAERSARWTQGQERIRARNQRLNPPEA